MRHRAADHGLFKATAERHARKKMVQTIRELQTSGTGQAMVVGAVRRAEASAIEFNLEQEVKFQRVDSLGNLPGRKLVVINRLLGIPAHHAYIEEALHGPLSSVILLAGPYELLMVDTTL